MAKHKVIGVRGINPELWRRFIARVESDEGKRRGKHSYVAARLNWLLEEYLNGTIKLSTRDTHIKTKALKEALRKTKENKKGYITKKDVDVAVAQIYGKADPRVIHRDLWYLDRAENFFKELGLALEIPSILNIREKPKGPRDRELYEIFKAKQKNNKPEGMYR